MLEDKIKQHREIPEGYKLKSVTVSKTPTGKYYASLLVEYEVEITPIEPNHVAGLDFSMNELYVASDDTSANYPHYYRESQKKLAKKQQKLSSLSVGGESMSQ